MRVCFATAHWLILLLASSGVAIGDEPKRTISKAVVSGDQELPFRKIGQAYKALEKHGIGDISLKVEYNLGGRKSEVIDRNHVLVAIEPTAETTQEEFFELSDALEKFGAVLTAKFPPARQRSEPKKERLAKFDPALPYTLQYQDMSWASAGSFRYVIDSTGKAQLFRDRRIDGRQFCVKTELQLSEAALETIETNLRSDDFALAEEHYSDPNIRDGLSLQIVLRQGDKEKEIFCSNRFPPFFEQLIDDIAQGLDGSGLETAVWTRLTLIERLQEKRGFSQ